MLVLRYSLRLVGTERDTYLCRATGRSGEAVRVQHVVLTGGEPLLSRFVAPWQAAFARKGFI